MDHDEEIVTLSELVREGMIAEAVRRASAMPQFEGMNAGELRRRAEAAIDRGADTLFAVRRILIQNF